MSALELLALRDYIADLRAAGAKGTLHREIKAFVAKLERETGGQPKPDDAPRAPGARP